jgi:hypothetical protein
MNKHLLCPALFLALPACTDDAVDPTGRVAQVAGDDLLLQRRTDYSMKVWHMDGAVHVGTDAPVPAAPVDPGWRVVATPDLSGDGRRDLLFQNETTGRLVSWHLVDLERVWGGFTNPMGPVDQQGNPLRAMEVRCAHDVNGDETPDLVFQDTRNDKVKVWTMDGMNRIAQSIHASPPLGYVLLGCHDFSGDDLADLVFLNNDNVVEMWEWDTTLPLPAWVVWPVAPPPSTSDLWRLAATTDRDGDGHIDLVFQGPWTLTHVNAPMKVWYMHYYTKTGEADVIEPSGEPSRPGDYWQLVGPK